MIIGREKWKRIKEFPLPRNIYRLVLMCEEFEEVIKRVDELAPYINSELYREAFVLTVRIVNTYLDMIYDIFQDDSIRREVLKDIHQYLRFLYDKDGNIDMSGTLVSVKSLEEADLVRKTFFMPVMAMIDAKIYDPLKEAIYQARVESVDRFLQKSIRRRGSLPILEEDIVSKFGLGSRKHEEEDILG